MVVQSGETGIALLGGGSGRQDGWSSWVGGDGQYGGRLGGIFPRRSPWNGARTGLIVGVRRWSLWMEPSGGDVVLGRGGQVQVKKMP